MKSHTMLFFFLDLICMLGKLVNLVDLFMSKRESMWVARLLNGSHALIERCTIVVFVFLGDSILVGI